MYFLFFFCCNDFYHISLEPVSVFFVVVLMYSSVNMFC